MMRLVDFLEQWLDLDAPLTVENSVVFGHAHLNRQPMHVLGVSESTFLGAKQAMLLASHVIDILDSKSKDPVLLLVDVAGQQLTMRDEWLGMQQYFAHLLETLECLRQQGNVLVSVVYNQALGGAFLAYGLTADTIFAVPDAKLAVMWLEGIAQVTKVSLTKLEELSKTEPVFAPGVQPFYELGGIHEIIPINQLAEKVHMACLQTDRHDCRANLGKKRGGRKLALSIMNQVLQNV